MNVLKKLKSLSSIFYNRGTLNVIEIGAKCSKRDYIVYPKEWIVLNKEDVER